MGDSSCLGILKASTRARKEVTTMAKGNGVGHQNDAFVAEEPWDRKEEKQTYDLPSIKVSTGVKAVPRGSAVLAARQTRKTTQFLAAAAGMNLLA